MTDVEIDDNSPIINMVDDKLVYNTEPIISGNNNQ